MKIKDLKLGQEIIIDGGSYAYRGVQKLKQIGYGKVQKIVFEGTNSDGIKDYKYYNLHEGNKDLEVNENVIELK
ncbi:hypothetical protein HZQ04_15710 [Elizabethkingia anophelis]|nr:hypothetical protein [Elizabethkingia anophelis]